MANHACPCVHPSPVNSCMSWGIVKEDSIQYQINLWLFIVFVHLANVCLSTRPPVNLSLIIDWRACTVEHAYPFMDYALIPIFQLSDMLDIWLNGLLLYHYNSEGRDSWKWKSGAWSWLCTGLSQGSALHSQHLSQWPWSPLCRLERIVTQPNIPVMFVICKTLFSTECIATPLNGLCKHSKEYISMLWFFLNI